MAPLTQAVRASFIEERGDIHVCTGNVDEDWTINAVLPGGYALGLIVSSCISSQAHTKHPEVAHVTGHFLHTTTLGQFKVHVRMVRKGRSYSNLVAELIQNDDVKISAHLIFGAPFKIQDKSLLSVLPPSPYARRIPLHVHPSMAQRTPLFDNANFHSQVKWAEDQAILERNRALGCGEGPAFGSAGLEWGAWLELIDPAGNMNAALIPFVADLFRSLPVLLPKDQRPPPSRHPTMVLSLEFKANIPKDLEFSRRTVGLYSCSRFMREGRHDVYVEVWTSPAAIGEGVEGPDWREKQVCLAIAHQMALTIPQFVNERKALLAQGKL